MATIAVVDNGGRGDALVWKLSTEGHTVYAVEGNGGTLRHRGAHRVHIESDIGTGKGVDELVRWAVSSRPDLTIIGSEAQLNLGLADMLRKHALVVLGSGTASCIERDKATAHLLYAQNKVPRPSTAIFTDYLSAIAYVNARAAGCVVKESRLAGGTGAVVCSSVEEARRVLHRVMLDDPSSDKDHAVLIEDLVSGEEQSVHALVCGTDAFVLPVVRDYKRLSALPGAPNTGSMGGWGPVPLHSQFFPWVRDAVVLPILHGLKARGTPSEGAVLYPGLMGVPETLNWKLLESNSRFGDSEMQLLVRILRPSLYDALYSCATRKITDIKMEWHDGFAVCVNLVSKGYPGPHEKGMVITGIEAAERVPGVVVFHAGTEVTPEGQLVTTGGRVLNVTATGPTLEEATDRAYKAVDQINFHGMVYRTDIGASRT